MNRQKIMTGMHGLALLIACILFASSFSSSVYALSEKGRIAGVPVRATLNRYEAGADAYTESDCSNMVHQVELTVWYYCVQPGGAVHAKKESLLSAHESAADTHAVHVSIALPDENIITTRALSRHHIYTGHYTWGVTLIDDEQK